MTSEPHQGHGFASSPVHGGARRPSISVIIPIHNAATTIAAQLNSLVAQEATCDFEVITVLNRCNDRSRATIASYRHLVDLNIIQADSLASAAHARNEGAKAARGEILLFCDADDRVSRGWVAGLARPLKDGSADFVGGIIHVDRTNLPRWAYDWVYASVDGKAVHDGDDLPYVLSASLGVTRDAFQAVGGFNEAFKGAGGEDRDLARRLLLAGRRLGVASDAAISYTPRRAFSDILKQQINYIDGSTRSALERGTLSAPPSTWSVLRTVAKVSVHRAVRTAMWRRPRLLVCQGLELGLRLESRRRASRSQAAPTAQAFDHAVFAVPVGTPLIGGRAFSCTPGLVRWHRSNGIETTSLAVLNHFLEPGQTCIDVGANIGLFAVAAAVRVGVSGRVFAFEPVPSTSRLLMENLERHQARTRVVISDHAVSDSRGARDFFAHENDAVSGFSIAPAVFQPGRASMLEVETTTLDVAVSGNVHFIKVDVEGHEAAVLRGARRVLGANRDAIILLEINPQALQAAGSSAAEVVDLLGERDLWLITEGPHAASTPIRPTDADELMRLEGDNGWFGNVLATPAALRERVCSFAARITTGDGRGQS